MARPALASGAHRRQAPLQHCSERWDTGRTTRRFKDTRWGPEAMVGAGGQLGEDFLKEAHCKEEAEFPVRQKLDRCRQKVTGKNRALCWLPRWDREPRPAGANEPAAHRLHPELEGRAAPAPDMLGAGWLLKAFPFQNRMPTRECQT